MAYEGGLLEPLFAPELADDATKDMADAGGRFVLERVIENTPVGFHNTTLIMQGFGDEVSRTPGTLKRSWYMLPVEKHASGVSFGYRREVATDDPIAPYVEYPTRAHVIRPKKPGGRLRFRAWPSGELVFAKLVHHPGTHGQFMLTGALNAAEIEFERICDPALMRWSERVYAHEREHNR